MEIITKGYMNSKVQPFPEWDLEVQDAIHEAMNLIVGKHGFRTHFEIWRNCELIITIGHNINTTSIEIRPPETALIRRRANWHNSYAYFSNGTFRANRDRTKVELI
ncbi:hypothetical protein [Dysgonomonas termitidis]|uniref:Chemotaxis phosphatase CheX-like domain-containing protein n=1 Tax=Dysgonomonas termitidis TaxID=1516126 RepID=A0ABV9L471_9BACT